MKSNIHIDEYLEVIRDFKKQYPTSHVGGSFGLFLHGIDLKRDLGKSDLDITVDEMPEINLSDRYEQSSNNADFDFQFRYNLSNQLYIKIDLRVTPEPVFDIISLNGYDYNVSKKRDILWWKQKYANNGSQKHIDDLIVINGGERPAIIYAPVAVSSIDDDLPF